MPRLALLGGAYRNPALIANVQRSVNLYPEKNPPTSGAPVSITHYPRPGLTRLGDPPQFGRGRCAYTATNGDLYVVVDQTVYFVDRNFTYTAVGALLTGGRNPVYIADNGNDAIVVDGSQNGYTLNLKTREFQAINDPNFTGADIVQFADNYLIWNMPGTPNWACTLLQQIAFNGLYFGTKTAYPDDIVSIISNERVVWVLGAQRSEIWFNAGTTPFPFAPVQGLIIEHGCAAKYSPAKNNVNIYWLSQNLEGARMVMRGAQNAATRISTHAIEEEFLKYPRVDDAIGSCYQIAGHSFYCLHFPTADKTWVFDDATDEWHEQASIDANGNEHRMRALFATYAYDRNVALDWSTGRLYLLDKTNYTDNGDPILCLRTMPHILNDEDARMTYWALIADVSGGGAANTVDVPVTESPWGLGFNDGFGPRIVKEPPLISIRMSRDRGGSWGDKVMQPFGAAGKYAQRPTWRRLGVATDAVFELSWSSPIPTALDGVFILYERHEGEI